MNQTWLFVCSGKIKISCWAFLVGHLVQILKLSYQDMNQKCKAAQTNQIHFLQDLTQIRTQKCNQKCNQLLNFPLHTKSHVWFISGWRPDAYRLGYRHSALARGPKKALNQNFVRWYIWKIAHISLCRKYKRISKPKFCKKIYMKNCPYLVM